MTNGTNGPSPRQVEAAIIGRDMAGLAGLVQRDGARGSTGTWSITASRALALLFAGSGLRCAFVAYAQRGHGSVTTALIVLCVACAGSTIALALGDVRSSSTIGHLLLCGVIAMNTTLIAVAPDRSDAILRAIAYPWSALYAAFFLSRRAARVFAALACACFPVGIVIAGLPHMEIAWLLISVTVVAVTYVTSALVEALRVQSETDHLTGLVNRVGFTRLAAHALASTSRRDASLAVIVCDIDGLKPINDLYGHSAGDALLVATVIHWAEALRAGDSLARLGGDEFGVLLPDTDQGGAEEAVHRLRRATSTAFSAGIAVRARNESLDELLGRADLAMYADKRTRNSTPAVPNQRRSASVGKASPAPAS